MRTGQRRRVGQARRASAASSPIEAIACPLGKPYRLVQDVQQHRTAVGQGDEERRAAATSPGEDCDDKNAEHGHAPRAADRGDTDHQAVQGGRRVGVDDQQDRSILAEARVGPDILSQGPEDPGCARIARFQCARNMTPPAGTV
jgi:hypothetical protein